MATETLFFIEQFEVTKGKYYIGTSNFALKIKCLFTQFYHMVWAETGIRKKLFILATEFIN